jgi:uncharacterized protein
VRRLIDRYDPCLVIALGDSFHDGGGPRRLHDSDRDMLKALQRGRDWLWIAGNNDPDPAGGIGATSLTRWRLARSPSATSHHAVCAKVK